MKIYKTVIIPSTAVGLENLLNQMLELGWNFESLNNSFVVFSFESLNNSFVVFSKGE